MIRLFVLFPFKCTICQCLLNRCVLLKGLPSQHVQSMIMHLLPQVLASVLHLLQSWSYTERLRACRILESIACFAQGGCAAHLEQLLPGICGAVADEDTQIAGWMSCTMAK